MAVFEKLLYKTPYQNNWIKMCSEQQRYYVFVSWKSGREPTQIHNELANAEGEQALSPRTVRRRIRTFKDGDEIISDKSRSGRPCEAVTPKTL